VCLLAHDDVGTCSCNEQHAIEGVRSALLTCEGLVSCQMAAVQQVQVAGKRQVLAEAAAVHALHVSFPIYTLASIVSTVAANCMSHVAHGAMKFRRFHTTTVSLPMHVELTDFGCMHRTARHKAGSPCFRIS